VIAAGVEVESRGGVKVRSLVKALEDGYSRELLLG
jgi:hypothetical protein